jgi:hypothetical protein
MLTGLVGRSGGVLIELQPLLRHSDHFRTFLRASALVAPRFRGIPSPSTQNVKSSREF